MKRYALKSIFVIAAFFIGVSINNSCGESQTDESTQPLLAGGSQEGSDNGEKYVDGLYFSRAGFVSSKIKRSTSSLSSVWTQYTYDSHGRQTGYIQTNDGITIQVTYEYSGKTVTQTQTVTYDPDKYPNIQNSITQLISEYY